MADCSASGTALDRVIHQLAVASSTNQGNNGIASVTSSAATAAYTNFLGGMAATASSSAGQASLLGGMLDAGRQIMPLAPLETLHRAGSTIMVHQADSMASTRAAQMDRAWVSSTASRSTNDRMNHTVMQHPQQRMQQDIMPMQGQIMQMHPQAAPQHNMMMMQQQHQQMMMMQQMHMQQRQMAAMVQYQKQQQQQQQNQDHRRNQKMTEVKKQQVSAVKEAARLKSNYIEQDDDVVTVSEEDQIHHEGFTSDASIERLAQAWRDAEEEYAQEFDELGDDNYDASDMGGMYSDEYYYESTAPATDANATTEPQYVFSEASQNYGCLQTTTTDIAPQSLSYPENLFEQGIQHFDEGNISEAILCFESTLRNIDPEHADAWRMLGKCHTEHDEDQKAIVCWLRSLERDPFSPETLLALGVAYVNELDHERAIETLKTWVANHPLYAGMVDDNVVMNGRHDEDGEEDLYGNPDDGTSPTTNADARQRMRPRTVVEMRDVERLLLRALEYDRTDDAAADVYEALGVVYNVSRDYDAAANAFRRAIDVRPMDYQLRNKLGATLANSNRSDEALPFYRAALSLKPKYARGWLNMAISHSNLHNYEDAVRCYLQTLSLNPDARHVWSYLRIALTCSEKWDLLGFAASQNLSAFHEYYEFVEY